MKTRVIIMTVVCGMLGFGCAKNTSTSMTSIGQGATVVAHPCVAAGYYATHVQCQFDGLNCSMITIQSGGSSLVCWQGSTPTPAPTLGPPVGPAVPDNALTE